MITVSYKLAEQMKEKGFPEGDHFAYVRFKRDKAPILIPLAEYDSYGNTIIYLCYAPTADEILAELRKLTTGVEEITISNITNITATTRQRSVIYGDGYVYTVNGNTLAEALGKLWLEVKE